MASAIDDATAAQLSWTPRAETAVDDPELPRSIPTAATEWAPKGRVIDDSARGTIFWEADAVDRDEDGDETPALLDGDEPKSVDDGDDAAVTTAADPETAPSGPQAFGKPFRIAWLSTHPLPFYRTRGLRNPWNANREVKIARDGTELETSVGRRLVQIFHRTMPGPGPGPGSGLQPLQQVPGMPIPIAHPSIRPL